MATERNIQLNRGPSPTATDSESAQPSFDPKTVDRDSTTNSHNLDATEFAGMVRSLNQVAQVLVTSGCFSEDEGYEWLSEALGALVDPQSGTAP